MRLVSSSLRSFGLVLALAACGSTDEAASTATTLSSNDPMSTGGELAPTAENSATLRLSGPAGTRTVGGALSSDYADMTTWDPGQGRLVAYFGGGDSAFGLTLNLGEPFAVGARRVTAGPVVFETGESFGQRIDVSDASVTVTALDTEARTIALRIEGTTSPGDGQAPEAFVLEANVVVPARAE